MNLLFSTCIENPEMFSLRKNLPPVSKILLRTKRSTIIEDLLASRLNRNGTAFLKCSLDKSELLQLCCRISMLKGRVVFVFKLKRPTMVYRRDVFLILSDQEISIETIISEFMLHSIIKTFSIRVRAIAYSEQYWGENMILDQANYLFWCEWCHNEFSRKPLLDEPCAMPSAYWDHLNCLIIQERPETLSMLFYTMTSSPTKIPTEISTIVK